MLDNVACSSVALSCLPKAMTGALQDAPSLLDNLTELCKSAKSQHLQMQPWTTDKDHTFSMYPTSLPSTHSNLVFDTCLRLMEDDIILRWEMHQSEFSLSFDRFRNDIPGKHSKNWIHRYLAKIAEACLP